MHHSTQIHQISERQKCITAKPLSRKYKYKYQATGLCAYYVAFFAVDAFNVFSVVAGFTLNFCDTIHQLPKR